MDATMRSSGNVEVVDSTRSPWLQFYVKDSYSTVSVFFDDIDKLKALSESLAKQIADLES